MGSEVDTKRKEDKRKFRDRGSGWTMAQNLMEAGEVLQ
jgi:hypothetical protein